MYYPSRALELENGITMNASFSPPKTPPTTAPTIPPMSLCAIKAEAVVGVAVRSVLPFSVKMPSVKNAYSV